MLSVKQIDPGINKCITSAVFDQLDQNCNILFADTNTSGVIIALVSCEKKAFIACFDQSMELFYFKPFSPYFDNITNLLATSDGGVICTGVVGTEQDPSFNSFGILKLDRSFNCESLKQYDLLYTDTRPVLFEDTFGNIICSGIKQSVLNGKGIDTYLLRLNKELQMVQSTCYDATNTIYLTSLISNLEADIIGVGFKRFKSRRTKRITETAVVITFPKDDLTKEYCKGDFNVWFDPSNIPTHINDATLIDEQLVCVGYRVKNRCQQALIWTFDDTKDVTPIRYIQAKDSSTSYSRIIQNREGNFLCIGRMRGHEKEEALLVSEFDVDLSYQDYVTRCFHKNEVINDTLFLNNTLINVGAKDSTIDDVSYGILKQVVL